MQVQAIPSPVLTQGPDLVGPDYALEIPRNSLQDQAIAENLVFRDTLLPKFDTVHASTPCNSDPSFRQGPFNYPSSVPYEHSPHGVHTWSQTSPSPVARNEFQSTPILVVPAPQRSLNYGAFLTPDPPCQISNIDLPPRPGTSPLRQTSALNGKLRLLPNIGRRRSEQTWQSYGSQSDSVWLPELPPPPEDIGQFGGNNYAPSSLAVSVETHALGPPTDNVRTHQFLIQQPVVSSTRERPSAPKPGPAQDHETAKSTVCQNRSSKERRQSNPKQMHQRAILPSTQSGNTQERTNQKFWPPKIEPSTPVVSSATEEHSSWRTTTAKRIYSHSNPENTVPAKKRKVVGEISEVTSTEPESTPVTHSQSQEQNASKPGQDCVYFDVNTWRGDNIASQDVPQSLSVRSSAQTQLQSGDGRSTERSLGKSTEGSSGKSGENVSPSQPSQLSYGDGEVPPGGSENWLPVGQGDGGSLQYMNWGPSVNMLLDQTLAFNLEVSGALDPAPEQDLTALIPVYPLEPNNFEIEGLADYYNMGAFSTVA
ncbi:hypothetical protein RSOLAG22IIIB_08947 [Rhizoctonia solani]|uniref:Uncharacterized protein n=1 Tax=Rhizoctonia solani TaxID=456999 RepID=A0A0K6FX30_9AGAM|nr:hypothetical protein RSOLAG22IIIB_08947 [Rhizoctonia solani]